MSARSDTKFEQFSESYNVLVATSTKAHDAIVEAGDDAHYSDDAHIIKRLRAARARIECALKHASGLLAFMEATTSGLCSICGHAMADHYDCTYCLEDGCGCATHGDADCPAGIAPLASEVER